MKPTNKSISYRGAPFIISAADVPTALNLLKTDSNFTGNDSRTGRTYFQDVQIHQAKVNILQAPVRAILLQSPPKIALMDIGGAAIGVLQGYLKDAGLYTVDGDGAVPEHRRRVHAVQRRHRLHDVERPRRRRLLDLVGAALGRQLPDHHDAARRRHSKDHGLHRRRPSVRRAVRRHLDDGRRQLAALVRRRAGDDVRPSHHQRDRQQRRPQDQRSSTSRTSRRAATRSRSTRRRPCRRTSIR